MAFTAPFVSKNKIAVWCATGGTLKKYAVVDARVSPQDRTYDTNVLTPTTGRIKPLVGPMWATGSMEMLMCGSGTTAPVTAPPDGPLLKACGFTEVFALSPATSVTYALTGLLGDSDSGGTPVRADLAVYEGGGLFHWLKSGLGNVRFSFEAGEPAKVHYDLSGYYTAPSEAASGEASGVVATPPVCKSLIATVGGQV